MCWKEFPAHPPTLNKRRMPFEKGNPGPAFPAGGWRSSSYQLDRGEPRQVAHTHGDEKGRPKAVLFNPYPTISRRRSRRLSGLTMAKVPRAGEAEHHHRPTSTTSTAARRTCLAGFVKPNPTLFPFRNSRQRTPTFRRKQSGTRAIMRSGYLEATVNGVLVASIYAPNGNPQPGPKFDYKLAWLKRLTAHAADLHASGAPVVLAGDYNVVPADLDIYPTKSWDQDALLQPESRAAYQRLLSQGWSDIRALHPKAPMYTFWDYMRNRWERDGGLRLDHILLNFALAERLQDAGVDR
jgi:hypothetical protein